MSTSLYRPSQQELDHAMEEMTIKYAGDAKRIFRARQLIEAGAVDYISQGIGWSVDSQRNKRQQDPEDIEPRHYWVSSTNCGCYDHLLRESAIGHCGDQQVVVHCACKHIFAVQMLLRIISARLNEAVSHIHSPAYLVEMRDNLYGVFDRATGEPICGAVYVVKTDSYRPEASQDAADFARWLAAQPLATEPAQWFPGGLLEQVLRGAPDKLTLRADVVYGSPTTYILSGYRYDGATWVKLEQEQRQQFNQGAWDILLRECGFIMPGRPVKQPGLAYNYLLVRGAADEKHYGLAARAGEYVERAAVRRMFEADLSGEQL